MKRLSFIPLLTLLAIIPLIVISCNKDEEIKLDFDLTVPDNWNYLVMANEGYIYSAEREALNENDTILEFLVIYKESLSSYTLQTYYTALKSLIVSGDGYISMMEEKDTVINGTDFKRLISRENQKFIDSTHDTTDIEMVSTRYFFYENKYGYNMVFMAIDSVYDEAKPVFAGIMSTFQYKE